MQSAASSWVSATPHDGGHAYRDPHFHREAQKVLPGEYRATRDDELLVTVLGSCVAACIRDPGTGVGGMNHFMLPETESPGVMSARYGSFAMELLLNELFKLGARRSHLEAKVFGGGNVLRGFTSNLVGSRNIEFVRQYLAAEKIRVAAEDLGDVCPRKVYFFPRSGRVMVRRLSAVQSRSELSEESAYQSRLSQQKIAGEIELFE